jgi:hypothetical protein
VLHRVAGIELHGAVGVRCAVSHELRQRRSAKRTVAVHGVCLQEHDEIDVRRLRSLGVVRDSAWNRMNGWCFVVEF